ncbi:NF-kappa-B essential modulator isoform X2 [Salarias fasciatus]|uniref:NF-kappa-B essential modulator isoform X2 n=1 Tax=Salarias fasciatus TaxID=181472 RepID=UPI001176AD35|nr:NF-kappa-B essential modulator isoform X2 [Salarias fasciatus]
MVQPQPDGPMRWGEDMSGDESGWALRVPPELASNEVVTKLLGDNQQLREALRRSNLALRQRCEEMEGWQRRTREEREFLSCRFQEARALVERLAQENHSLQGLVNGPASSSSTSSNHCCSSSQTEDPQARPARNGPVDRSKTLDQWKSPEGAEQHTQTTPPRSLGDSLQSSLSFNSPSLPKSFSEGTRDEMGRDGGQPVEGANEFLQLLKSHKEKLEEGMKELRKKNEELEKEKEQGEKERERIRQFCNKLVQAQASGGPDEAVLHRSEAQHSSDCSSLAKLTEQLQATQGRYRELEEKLDHLQKSSAQRDRTEALLKQKDKECAQLAKDCEALKAQATSLLLELKERQSCLDKSEHERKSLEEERCNNLKALQVAKREQEQQRKQHQVAMDKLMLQTQSLEQALKTERKKLTQLQHAYTCLFRDYDSKLKSEGGDLSSRLEDAERALALKQDLIDKLKEEVEQQKGSLETIPVLTAQAEIYKADFLAEREAREKLNQKKEELQDQLNQALSDIDRLKQEATSRARMEQMKLRHLEDFPPRPSHISHNQGAAFNTVPAAQSFRNQGLVPVGDQGPDLCCPKCQYLAPDMDTLQIHVMDCIQ